MQTDTLIIIVTYNSSSYIRDCLTSLETSLVNRCHCIVIDNASKDDTMEKLAHYLEKAAGTVKDNITVTSSARNLGFAGGIDHVVFGLAEPGKYQNLVFLNPDTKIEEDTIENLLAPLDEDCNGASGGLILDMKTGMVQHAGGIIKENFITVHQFSGRDPQTLKEKNFGSEILYPDYVTGALFATKMSLFRALGGFDRGYRPAYYEELDYCLLLKKIGKKTVLNLHSRASHIEGGSVERFSGLFYKYYHKNRIRCAIINLGLKSFFKVFLPAERSWLKGAGIAGQKKALLYAYFLNFLFLPYNLAVKVKRYILAAGYLRSD